MSPSQTAARQSVGVIREIGDGVTREVTVARRVRGFAFPDVELDPRLVVYHDHCVRGGHTSSLSRAPAPAEGAAESVARHQFDITFIAQELKFHNFVNAIVTTKTQFLFRINKGVTNSWDDAAVNRWQPMDERPVPFTRMIFIGDGDTDIPSMKMVRHQGGYSIAVYDEELWREKRSKEKLHRLIAEDRAHFVAPANYADGSQLDVIVRGILGRFAIDAGYRGP